jgi:hypothetical protein
MALSWVHGDAKQAFIWLEKAVSARQRLDAGQCLVSVFLFRSIINVTWACRADDKASGGGSAGRGR